MAFAMVVIVIVMVVMVVVMATINQLITESTELWVVELLLKQEALAKAATAVVRATTAATTAIACAVTPAIPGETAIGSIAIEGTLVDGAGIIATNASAAATPVLIKHHALLLAQDTCDTRVAAKGIVVAVATMAARPLTAITTNRELRLAALHALLLAFLDDDHLLHRLLNHTCLDNGLLHNTRLDYWLLFWNFECNTHTSKLDVLHLPSTETWMLW